MAFSNTNVVSFLEKKKKKKEAYNWHLVSFGEQVSRSFHIFHILVTEKWFLLFRGMEPSMITHILYTTIQPSSMYTHDQPKPSLIRFI